VPADEPEHGEPELDAAHVDAAWRDIMANYGDRPAMPAAADAVPAEPEAPAPEPADEPEPEPEWWEREEHFTPPEPPPAPLPRTPRGLAWVGALGLPVLAIVLTFVRITVPGWLATIGVLAFLASLGYLFATMPSGHDDDPFDGNNGAVV
jgi:hypothetical protein